ncbi:hypothetical protein [Caulobacter segnis]
MTDHPMKPENRALIERALEISCADGRPMLLSQSAVAKLLDAARQEGRCSPGEGGDGQRIIDGLGQALAGDVTVRSYSMPRAVSSPPPSGEVREAEVAALLKDANLYHSMRQVALANGFESISEAIAKAVKGRDEAALPEPREGWVLVPREPTDDMLTMGGNAATTVCDCGGGVGVSSLKVWSAMLAAVPQAPAAELPGDVVTLVREFRTAVEDHITSKHAHSNDGHCDGVEEFANVKRWRAALAPFADRVPLDNEGEGR